MNTAEQKLVQYLNEAQAAEQALIRVLQSQIAMAPRGSYRSGLETHLAETRDHAGRVGLRLEALGQGSNPLLVAVGLAQIVVGQVLALGKTPFDLLRGSGGEEKALKNAKDACATAALEIATYTALERLARSVGDDETARLAASIRDDEEKMLERILREIPKLTEAVVGADLEGQPSYDVNTTGAADAVRDAGEATRQVARETTAATKRTARQAGKVPGVAQAEGQVKGAAASEDDLAIARYDSLTADEITGRLAGLSQIELAKVDAYEHKNQNRATILSRISSLRGDEPWPGYDELTAAEVQAVLSEGDDDRAKQVRSYERAHKNRASVRQPSASSAMPDTRRGATDPQIHTTAKPGVHGRPSLSALRAPTHDHGGDGHGADPRRPDLDTARRTGSGSGPVPSVGRRRPDPAVTCTAGTTAGPRARTDSTSKAARSAPSLSR